ncbi:hypothetical protein IKG31_01990 [Candidatus Saccharibacteria bacterium]|nr:hypothetical protein [Candidatus Saccharibacteria bacterium]
MKMAFPEALRNICGRCKADKGRCKSCPVTRIAEEYGTEEYSFHQLELIRSMIIRREGNWFTGSIDGYPFQVKVSEEDSAWGIDNGRIIKLFITEKPEGDTKGDKEIVAYERGWSTYPENHPEYEELIDALHEYFQNHMDSGVT